MVPTIRIRHHVIEIGVLYSAPSALDNDCGKSSWGDAPGYDISRLWRFGNQSSKVMPIIIGN
jgi:hypothetical protein